MDALRLSTLRRLTGSGKRALRFLHRIFTINSSGLYVSASALGFENKAARYFRFRGILRISRELVLVFCENLK